MQKMLMAIAAVALLISGSSAVARTEGVDITKDGFKDTTVTIESGDSVTWKNTDTADHQVMVDNTSC
jgi:plastocyanin